ncbi:UDP-glucose 4-epimerase [Sarcophilus harrisii]|uniref:UDP-glucose 4-epimerase n=1 Tax=Sarcophilus harrisii TaxID=9305 RepID=UPI001301FD6A|nr:UDP-glucose 4-epimerase [Sarcophilus harrisii]
MADQVLVTGGAGYIGSHTVLELLEAGYRPVVIDNFHNTVRGEGPVPESLRRVEELTGKKVEFEEMDILDKAALQGLFKKHSFSAVVHFAGLKAVGESVQKPLDYYKVNLTGTIQLLETMKTHGVKNLVFSSSATVYGNPSYLPLDENHPTGGCTNPYGKSKFFIEEMIQDLCRAEKDWERVAGRKELPNPMGPIGMGGPTGPQGNPGAPLRFPGSPRGRDGPEGRREIPYRIVARRDGDVAACYANPKLAQEELGWTADFGLDKMCEDLWRWQEQNPMGFGSQA